MRLGSVVSGRRSRKRLGRFGQPLNNEILSRAECFGPHSKDEMWNRKGYLAYSVRKRASSSKMPTFLAESWPLKRASSVVVSHCSIRIYARLAQW